MIDTDLIRRAVALAPGWEWLGEQETLTGEWSSFIKTPIGSLSVSINQFIKIPAYSAALAAALVEEVEKAGKRVAVENRWAEVTDPEGDIIKYADGPDRTENTLRACVAFLEGLRDE